ncbi:rpsE [Symbiodinium natans]|uniref:RpsE protein n=1 Tax=Symbiodinium natans TaxID=878477 RepID=A0A812PY14_9DINO|nr:rpsE [Symbiodinium natans]
MQDLFSNEAAKRAIKPQTLAEKQSIEDVAHKRELNNEALRVYRLLRPEAPRFFEEDAMLGMKARMSQITQEDSNADRGSAIARAQKLGDPFKAHLPVVNQKAFLLALESVVASLAEDLETLCRLVGMDPKDFPTVEDPLRFYKLLNILFDAFPLEKDPRKVPEFMQTHWLRLKALLPEELFELDETEVEKWLTGHLERVLLNQKRYEQADQRILLHNKRSEERWYNFAEDFPYDDDPMPDMLADERNLFFPLEKAQEYMQLFLNAFGASKCAAVQRGDPELGPAAASLDSAAVSNQFQDLVWDLEDVGLRNWLKMDIQELERNMPKGEVAQLVHSNTANGDDTTSKLYFSDDDVQVAKLMLQCAARGKADLLDFEAVDPYKLLHGMPATEVAEELATLPPNPHLDDDALHTLVDEHQVRLARTQEKARPSQDVWQMPGGIESATVEDLYRKELEFYRTAGPVEWQHSKEGWQWQWRQPPNTFWDERRKVYIQEQKGIDPNLELREMRQHMLDVRRMRSMCAVGRVIYFRALVVVGNGKGVYGFGIGFGNTPKESRTDAMLKAMQNLDYIDFDPGRMLTTPCKGTEYKHEMTIIPRPIGRGLKCNKKFLPLLYILGFNNMKVKFMHQEWFTRVKAIKRCLDKVMSRRTLANMTGKRYALLVAPGDHWVHWPDRWFDVIRQPYDAKEKYRKLLRKHALHFKKRGVKIATPLDLYSGWYKRSWARWNSPLDRWLQHRRENYDPEVSFGGATVPSAEAKPSKGMSPPRSRSAR